MPAESSRAHEKFRAPRTRSGCEHRHKSSELRFPGFRMTRAKPAVMFFEVSPGRLPSLSLHVRGLWN
jgi:hypothetical protein